MNLQYLIKYQSFISVEDMDATVQEHINVHHDQLTESTKAVLYCLASHSLSAPGACHLLTETIANEISVSTQTVYRATKKLTELGIITKHKTVKRTGQGASIYVIAPKINTRNVSHSMSDSCQSLETHVKPVIPTDSHIKIETVTKNLSTSSFNPFVEKNVVNNVNACAMQQDLKSSLRAIYNPQSVEGNQAFDELCKIAFGRLKQYMRTHSMPYLQMEQIVLKAMNDLVRKQGVRNQFAMYSKMIERQTLQLFEKPIEPVKATRTAFGRKVGVVPEWFETEKERQAQGIKEQSAVEQMSVNEKEDFERRKAELQKRIAQM